MKGLDSAEDITKLRAHLAAMKAKLNAANRSEGDVAFVEVDRDIVMRDGASIAVRIRKNLFPISIS